LPDYKDNQIVEKQEQFSRPVDNQADIVDNLALIRGFFLQLLKPQ
jgi:hypothetical protein